MTKISHFCLVSLFLVKSKAIHFSYYLLRTKEHELKHLNYVYIYIYHGPVFYLLCTFFYRTPPVAASHIITQM